MKLIFTILTLLLTNMNHLHAQSEEERVKLPVMQLFNGMRQSDTAMIRSAFHKNASLHSVIKNKKGETVFTSETLDNFIEIIGKPHTEIYDERIEFETIKIDGNMAIAWTPYKFFVGEKFSHCGVNVFLLVKEGAGWKIQTITDTRRKDPGHCEERR